MNTSQIKSQANALTSRLSSLKSQVDAARADMLRTKGLDHAIASARYASLAFESGKLAKRSAMHAGAVAALEQANVYSAQGRKNEAFGATVVAATMLGMSGTVKRLQMVGPRFVSAAMIQKAATPVSGSTSYVERNAMTPAELAAHAGSVFKEFDGYGDFGEAPDVGQTDEGVAENSQEQENAGFSEPPTPIEEVPDGKLTTDDGKTSIDLADRKVKEGMADVQAGAAKVKTGIDQIDTYHKRADVLVGDLKNGNVGGAIGSGAGVVVAAVGTGMGIAGTLLAAGAITAVLPAGPVIGAVIVLAVGIYCLVELLSDDDPPAPTIAAAGKVPRWLTNGDPNVANVLLAKRKANVQVDGPTKLPTELQKLVLERSLPGGHPLATPPGISGTSSGIGAAAAGAGVGFLAGGPVGAVGGALVGWLLGKK